jgi:hypothetical protein
MGEPNSFEANPMVCIVDILGGNRRSGRSILRKRRQL